MATQYEREEVRFTEQQVQSAISYSQSRHIIGKLAEWQTTKTFDYSGRGQSAEPRFQKAECGIFIGSSATRADIKANS